MNKLPLLLILFVAACSSYKEKVEKKQTLMEESWKGHNVAELREHPYFKDLSIKKVTHEGGIETWVFRQQTKFQTGAYCQSLGGCMGMPQYSCDNTFSVKNDVILGYEQTGGCPDTKTSEPLKK